MGRYALDGDDSIRAAEGDATLLVCLVGAICCSMRGEEVFFHATHVRSDCLSLSQASRLVGKAKAARREQVATAFKYPLLMGCLDRAAFFCPF